jgi:hypothetical protein
MYVILFVGRQNGLPLYCSRGRAPCAGSQRQAAEFGMKVIRRVLYADLDVRFCSSGRQNGLPLYCLYCKHEVGWL